MVSTCPSTERTQIHGVGEFGAATACAAVDPVGQSADAVNGSGASAVSGATGVDGGADGAMRFEVAGGGGGAGSGPLTKAAVTVVMVATRAMAAKAPATQGLNRRGL